jgi:hypothetical protein
MKNQKNDYTTLLNKKVGTWYVKDIIRKKDGSGQMRDYYVCDCVCGLEREVLAKDIWNGKSKNCGCGGKYKVGYKQGKLTILKNTGMIDNGGSYLIECRCDCGKIIYRRWYQFEHAKKLNYSMSCGCLNISNPEQQIMFLLENWGIDYIYNYTDGRFELRDEKKHKLFIDFYLPEYDLYIEYDGKQHFVDNGLGAGKLKRRQELDQIKDSILKNKLYRISYNEDVEKALYNIIKSNVKKRIYFITSDEHGCYNEIIKAEQEKGYNETNPLHYRISAGDCWDRGLDGVKIYEYYKRLCDEGKMTVCKGNHVFMLIDWLETNNFNTCYFNYRRNGLRTTIDDFTHVTLGWDTYINLKYTEEEQMKMTAEDWNTEWVRYVKDSAKQINKEYPDLLPWLKSLPDYLELKNSIITHGMIDCVHGNWRTPLQGWEACHWAKPKDAAFLKNDTGKHIYLGHIDADTIRECYHLEPENQTIFTRPEGDVTYLDSCTILTHRVNMNVIEDEPLEDKN